MDPEASRKRDFAKICKFRREAQGPQCQVVYVFPVIGLSGAMTVVVLAIQVCEVGLIMTFSAQWVTVVSEVTYPVLYMFPMIGVSSAKAVVGLATQVGNCESDLIVQ